MRRILLALALALAAGAAAAEYVTGFLVSDVTTEDLRYHRCTYRTMTGLTFVITKRGVMCPPTIQFDPETGRFR